MTRSQARNEIEGRELKGRQGQGHAGATASHGIARSIRVGLIVSFIKTPNQNCENVRRVRQETEIGADKGEIA